MTPAEFRALAKRFEGLYLRPYLCPAGVDRLWGDPVPGRSRGDPERPAHHPGGRRGDAARPGAHNLLACGLKLCPGIDTPERLAAIIDWTFNLGAGNLKASTLRKRINANRRADVPAEIRKWNRGGGRVLRGLVLRREAETSLI
ncbi:lysozyme [Cupriavidus sp. AcVe19-6a]|uniref:lysozyme n=1 Tax=Cupriavidus sp. AcVe19-6a TaxID=2821358 RepID=UPI001AE6575F|nr:lysozyme [Cupriavidus sp. AcVe19-6a]MBP0634660.1 lysozyme [Cupriavidus sp. AcVe19-6a]